MLIYRQYNQAALDEQYNNRLHVPDFANYFNRWEILSRQTENEYPVIKNIAYGNGHGQCLDIYPSPLPQSKTLIFIHGGYWQMFDKSSFQFIAKAFRSYNITTVLLAYPMAPLTSMDNIVCSCRQAVYWLYQHLDAYNGNIRDIYVAGHSAGGHLAAMLMATDWSFFNKQLPVAIFNGACMISGLFNLIPIQLSNLNKVLKMDKEMAIRNSPVQFKNNNQSPVLLVVGEDETAEFKDQSHQLYSLWQAQLIEIPRLNHFSILETILDPGSLLHTAMRRLMKIE